MNRHEFYTYPPSVMRRRWGVRCLPKCLLDMPKCYHFRCFMGGGRHYLVRTRGGRRLSKRQVSAQQGMADGLRPRVTKDMNMKSNLNTERRLGEQRRHAGGALPKGMTERRINIERRLFNLDAACLEEWLRMPPARPALEGGRAK